MDLIITILPVVTKDLPISPRFTPYNFYRDSSSALSRSTPVAQLAPRNLLTRWDVSSIPANGIFLTKN